jgi:hypothetical protein
MAHPDHHPMTDMTPTNRVRQEFEAWLRTTYQPGADNSAWAAWQAATAAERERCAKVCDRLSEGAWLAEQIRKG